MKRLKLSKHQEVVTKATDELQVMYKSWAAYFKKNELNDLATNYYDKSLELLPTDHQALYYRSKCYRDSANPKAALEDSVKALETMDLFKKNATLEVCDNLYALNEFENNKMALHDGLNLFAGSTIEDSFKQRLCVVDDNFHKTVGDTLTSFLIDNNELLDKVHEIHKKKMLVDNRPLWKIIREQGNCDVLSIFEKEEKLISPRKIMKKKRVEKIFIQTYLNRTSEDVLFLEDLLKDSNLLMRIFKQSTPFIKDLIQTKIKNIHTFTRSLHARSPLYTKEQVHFPNRKLRLEQKDARMFRIQEQTRRIMYRVLRHTKALRAKGNIKELIKFVEQMMSDYVSIKTHRIMPWKLDFVYEIYNTLGLAFIDRLQVPDVLNICLPVFDIKRSVLGGPNASTKSPVSFKFGDKSTYQDLESMQKTYNDYKKHIGRLEKRMVFTKYDIEKCYLYHEIARIHLKELHFNECVFVANKGVQACLQYNLPMWAFLTNMLIARAHSSLGKNEHERDALLRCQELAKKLKNEEIDKYIGFCLALNSIATSKHPSLESERRKMSMEVYKRFSSVKSDSTVKSDTTVKSLSQ